MIFLKTLFILSLSLSVGYAVSDVTLNSIDPIEYSPLQKAVLNGDVEAVKTWLAKGAVVNTDFPSVNSKGKPSKSIPVLIKITSREYSIPLEIIELLLKNGLDVSVVDTLGNTGLMRAVYLLKQKSNPFYRNKLIELLVRHKVPIDAQNKDGNTALHIASLRGDLETVRLLLQNSADWALTNREGRTALQAAKFMASAIPLYQTGLRWYWYFSFFGKQYKVIRLLERIHYQAENSSNTLSQESCQRSFI